MLKVGQKSLPFSFWGGVMFPTVLLTRDEAQTLLALAQQRGVSVGDYLRALIQREAAESALAKVAPVKGPGVDLPEAVHHDPK